VPQVSKAISRLEGQLGKRLLDRTARAATPTPMGAQVLPQLEAIVRQLEQLHANTSGVPTVLRVAAGSSVAEFLFRRIPHVVPRLRIRAVQLPPPIIRGLASESYFDIAVMVAREGQLPSNWVIEPLGPLRSGLFMSPETWARWGKRALTPEEVKSLCFIVPVYCHEGSAILLEDDCPIPTSLRKMGHEAETMRLGLDLAASSDHAIFGPLVAAKAHLREGRLVHVPVAGWEVARPLSLACNGDVVSSSLQRALLQEFRDALDSDQL
jgi:DNA-binding transcriptional LysR family regulator